MNIGDAAGNLQSYPQTSCEIGLNPLVRPRHTPGGYLHMTTWITICDTCKRDGWELTAMGQTDGEGLAQLIEAAAAGSAVATRRVSCTMGCERACNVVIQAPGKFGYSLGKFEATADAAAAIVAYATQHAASATGQVPFREWPLGVKGHFVSRHVPLPDAGPNAGPDVVAKDA